MNTVKLGFIGCGFVAQQVHLPCFAANNHFEIVALADPLPDLSALIAQRYGIKRIYSNHTDLLKDDDIDAVVITLPRRLAYRVVKDSLMAFKHVFTEKPICLNLENGNELLDLSKKHQRIVQVGYMKEHDSGTSYFKDVFESLSNDIKLVRAYSYMGDSYCSPFGDIKSLIKDDDMISSPLEAYPAWLRPEQYFAYEQFLNVHSHILHACESIFSTKIAIESIYCNNLAEGLFCGQIGHIPFSLEAVRGSQLQWLEGISFKTTDTQCEIKYPPPFLRNSPAEVITMAGDSSMVSHFHQAKWSWAFMNQTYNFYRLIRDSFTLDNLNRAVRQVQLASEIFQMKPLSHNG